MIKAGFHLSVAGGIYNAPAEAKRMGYRAFQLFASSPRTWEITKIPASDADKFAALREGIDVLAHIPYLCNPSTSNPDVYSKSLAILKGNMTNCAQLGVENVVIHLGSHLGKGVEYGKERTVKLIAAALDSVKGVGILLENSAGYRNCVGDKMEDIGDIIRKLDSDRVGMCFDTCHAFASGYELRTKEGVSKLVDEIEEYIGKDRLRFVHLNDAKADIGSGLDRHYHIGKGKIGVQGFKELFSNKLFRQGDFVMETPEDDVSDNRENMKALQGILADCGLRAN